MSSVTTLGGRRADQVTVQVRRGRVGLTEDAAVARDQQRQRLGPSDVNADRDVDHRCRSACAFSSRRAWVWMRYAARDLMNVGIGTSNSTSRS